MKDSNNNNYNTLKQLISSCNVILYIVLMKLTLIDYFKVTTFPIKYMADVKKETKYDPLNNNKYAVSADL